MRFEGLVKSWSAERGFGFIEPTQGGQEIFVHIKAFSPRVGQPRLNQIVTFEVELNGEGKKRARMVQIVKPARAARHPRNDAPAQWGIASLFAIPAFFFLYIAIAMVWRVPLWFAALYVVASIVCFLAYAIDKSAAVAGRWRISESTLILLGLAGGWPGAIVAQQALRHKSSKASFRSAFWASVAMNVCAFIAFNSPIGAGIRS